MQPSRLRELSGVAWAVLASPFYALFSPHVPDSMTMTVTLSRRVGVSRSAMYRAFDSIEHGMSLPPSANFMILSADPPQRYRMTLLDGSTLDMAITERVQDHFLRMETVFTDAPNKPTDFSQSVETFKIVESHGLLALNFVMVLVLRKKLGRLTGSFVYLLITQLQTVRLDHMISLAQSLDRKTNS